MTETDDLQTLKDLMKDARTGVLTTLDGDKIVSRPMALQTVEFDGDMWFFTAVNSNKVSQIAVNSQVNVAFENKDNWVSVAGTAEVIEDRAKSEELWNPFIKAYFPDGLEDPNLRLIKVHADSAEYWKTGNRASSMLKMLKAAATNTTPDMGENKTLEL